MRRAIPAIVGVVFGLLMSPAQGQQAGDCFIAPRGAFSAHDPDTLSLKKLATVKRSPQYDYVMERYSYESILPTYANTKKLLAALTSGKVDIILLANADCRALMQHPDGKKFEVVGTTVK